MPDASDFGGIGETADNIDIFVAAGDFHPCSNVKDGLDYR